MTYPTVTEHHKLYPYTSVMASPYSCDPTGVTDIATAIESIKANQSNIGTIYFPHGTYKLSTNLTIPDSMNIELESGALISIATGVTLTCKSPPVGYLKQLFSCTGTGAVVFTDGGTVPAELFGWSTSASAANNAIYMQKATDSVTTAGGTVTVNGFGTYSFTNFTVPAGVSLKFAGSKYCILSSTGADYSIKGSGKWHTQRFSGFTLTHASNTNSGVVMIDGEYGATSCTFEDIELTGKTTITSHGLYIRGYANAAGAGTPATTYNNNCYNNRCVNIRTNSAS